jgi:hypothetical protein
VVKGKRRELAMSKMNKMPSFWEGLLSEEARRTRREKIRAEKEAKIEAKKRFSAWGEAIAFTSPLWFLSVLVLFASILGGVIALFASFCAWHLMYWLSYRYGPLVKGSHRIRKSRKVDSVFFGPRGGRYRMSPDGKRRIYF